MASVLLLLGSGSLIAQYPGTSGVLNVDDSSRCRWTLSGTGFAPGATVTLESTRGVTPLGTAVADATGAFSFVFIVDRNTRLGRQTFSATGLNPLGGIHTLSASVVVKGGCRAGDPTDEAGFIGTSLPPPSVPPGAGLSTATALAFLLAAVMIGSRSGVGSARV